MREMLDGYSKDVGITKTERWDSLRSQFESVNIAMSNYLKSAGRASEATKYLREALYSVANTPLYEPLKRQLAELIVSLNKVKTDVKELCSLPFFDVMGPPGWILFFTGRNGNTVQRR